MSKKKRYLTLSRRNKDWTSRINTRIFFLVKIWTESVWTTLTRKAIYQSNNATPYYFKIIIFIMSNPEIFYFAIYKEGQIEVEFAS